MLQGRHGQAADRVQAGQQADQGGDRRAGRRAEGQGARGRQAQRGGCGEGVTGRGLQDGVAGLLGWGHMRLTAGQTANGERQSDRLTRSWAGEVRVWTERQADKNGGQ